MVFVSTSLGAPVGIGVFQSPTGPSFFGNPNASVTSVNTSGGIVKSRSSGSLPAFVQVSASAITATGSSWLNAYEDLDYSWNFGDQNGTEVFTNPTTGLSVNANSDQKGPEAAYVYRVANTYTITLTIKWRNAGVLNQTSITTTFTANTFTPTNEYYVDPVGGSDGNAGTSSGAPWKTFTPVRAANWNGMRLNLKRGTTIDDYLGRAQSRQSVRIQSYGNSSDPDPIIATTSPSASASSCLWIDNGSAGNPFAILDWVISRVTFSPGGTVSAPILLQCGNPTVTAFAQDMYLDNCRFNANNGSTVNIVSWNPQSGLTNNMRAGCWGCSTYGQTGALDGAQRQGIAIQGWKSWLFVVGGHHEGNGQDNIRDHHIYPIFQTHGLFRWIDFGTGTHRSHCVNTDWNNDNTLVTCTAGTIDNGSGTGSPAGSVFTPAGTISGTFAVGQTINASGLSTDAFFLLADLGGGKFSVAARDTGSLVSFALTPRAMNCATLQYAEFILYDGCSFGGLRFAFDADDFNNNYNLVNWRNNICQNCDFRSDLTEAGPLAFSFTGLTIRDCEVWSGGSFWNPGTMGYYILGSLAFRVYRNKFYQSGTVLSFTTSGGIPITATQFLQWTDNECYDTRTGATFIFAKASDLSNSIIDRNKYYAPNDTDGKIFFQNGTSESLATWKTHGANFDPTSTDTKPPFPNWIDPANGNFNT